MTTSVADNIAKVRKYIAGEDVKIDWHDTDGISAELHQEYINAVLDRLGEEEKQRKERELKKIKDKEDNTKQGYCAYCGKKLRAFTVTEDWKTRKYHKTCWKEHEQEMIWKEL